MYSIEFEPFYLFYFSTIYCFFYHQLFIFKELLPLNINL